MRVRGHRGQQHHAGHPLAAAAGYLIAAGQKALRAAMVDLADNFPFDKEMVSVQQTLAVLANNEAAIANKAERLRAKFEVNSYAGFKFLQAITLMNRVKSDLDSYRYQNVMRTKDQTLAALKQSRLRIGEIDVTADESAGMPKYVRDNIADAMKGKLPEEFKDVLEQYYKRLSEQK